jgi:putative membrane-bound dehydrogenase-like protein
LLATLMSFCKELRRSCTLAHAMRSAVVLLAVAGTCLAQHGRFDQAPVNPAEEASIFTPPGFEREGKPAVAEGDKVGRLNVAIVDAATGKPALCRVNVVGADGNFYQPKENTLSAYSLTGKWPDTLAGNRPSKAPIRYFGRFFYTQGTFSVDVPQGPVRIEVWKGFEYRPEMLSTHVSAGQQSDVRLTIARTAPMTPLGWHSGDSHLHLKRASDADDETIFDLLEAEDINFGSILCYNETNTYPGVMPELATPQLRGLGVKSIRRRGNCQIVSGQEYRNVVYGHLNLFLRDHLVLDGQQLDPNLGPVFGTIGAETQKLGGYAFHAHGGYALEIWADLVQGATNGVELLQFGIYRGIGLDGWYHVLNAGFRFPAIGASDYPACRKLGDCRTYVHIGGEPNFKDWFGGAAAGRSFVTTGPLVLLEVDGKRPGDTIDVQGAVPHKVRARVRVRSETAPVTDVQLIVNGRVARELKVPPAAGAGQWIELDEPLTLNDSSWIAARAFSVAPSGSADAEAHTNPVYVHRNGTSPYHAADADWLIERLDEQIADHQARTAEEKSVPIEYFRRARETLLERRQRNEATPKDAGAKPPSEPKMSPGAQPIDTTPGSSQGKSLADYLKPVPAKSPAEALKTFEVHDGFRMELVASEPDVVDPVAACFDEDGGMYVGEMIDYPYRPKEGQKPLGRVRYLEDADGDGRYEHSWVFADEIVWPTGVVCWKGGVFVAAAPDVWYLKDTNGDHVADVREKIFTGFGDRNQQGGVNNLNWHVDHTIYGSGSTNGGSIQRVDKPEGTPIVLSGRDFRFDPVTRRFETVSGRKQFGNAFDDWFNRFLCSESDPSCHVVLPQHYLARNPFLAVPSAIKDLTPGVTPIFRTSPIEKWREIRSSRRLAAGERSPNSAGLSHNVIDAAAGLTIYRGHAYPSEYRGQLFVGCSQNNLIHRRKLIADGPTFRSVRADDKTEFVRSTDTWFRPVNCINAPDGTLYVLDMSREVIESIHIANDVVAHLDLTSGRDKGRIYRLAPSGFKSDPSARPRLGKATTKELVGYLDHPSGWWRDTASRLIFERQDRSVIEHMRRRLQKSTSDVGRMHILWALDGLDALSEQDLVAALADPSPGVREHAVRLAEPRMGRWPPLLDGILRLAEDAAPRVRFQVAFSLGETTDPRAVAALAAIARRDADDSWTRTAVLSSSTERADRIAGELLSDSQFAALPASGALLEQLASIVGARNQQAEIAPMLDATAAIEKPSGAPLSILLGLGSGLQRSSSSLSAVAQHASPAARGLIERLLTEASAQAKDSKLPNGKRESAVRLLGFAGGEQTADVLTELVSPQQPEPLALAAVRTLARNPEPKVAVGLVAVWRAATPKVQEEIIGVLASRQTWAMQLLDACEREEITPSQVTRAARTTLLGYEDSQLHARAEKLFGAGAGPRGAVLAKYQRALEMVGDAARGDKVFDRECMACHRLGDRGSQVGPNLALIRNRTPQALVEAILDPNREVQPAYVSYVIVDDSGRSTNGLIASETDTSITLAREKGVTETILKQNIEQLHSTGKSLMPEGLEKTIDPQSMADLLAFLKQVQYDIGTLPDFVEAKD